MMYISCFHIWWRRFWRFDWANAARGIFNWYVATFHLWHSEDCLVTVHRMFMYFNWFLYILGSITAHILIILLLIYNNFVFYIFLCMFEWTKNEATFLITLLHRVWQESSYCKVSKKPQHYHLTIKSDLLWIDWLLSMIVFSTTLIRTSSEAGHFAEFTITRNKSCCHNGQKLASFPLKSSGS